MDAQKMSQPNQGIKCSVNTCYYYMNGDNCSASRIQVEPKDARDSQETDCATFKPGNMNV
jgi:hypothetical protein